MFLLHALVFATCAFHQAYGQVQAPALAGRGAPISSRDRIYTGDQTSNTVTVIDPSSNTVLGTVNFGQIRLGNIFNPQTVASANSHGLGFSRDGKYIVSLSTLTNTATIIRTRDNAIVSQTYVDRGPHEAFFAPDNRTVWIGTRGVSSINIIDKNGTFIQRIFTGAGPSKVLFSPDGQTAYVNHIDAPVIGVIDVATRTVEYNITGLADKFSSDMMLSADGGRLWAAHKMTGQVSVVDTHQRNVVTILDTGTETNHPNFAIVNGTTYGFVTVAAINATRVYSQRTPSSTPVFVKDIRMTGIEPHGIWPSPDNTRMYVVNEHSDSVDTIDTNSMTIINTVGVGQEGQALVYVANAVPEGSNGTENLGGQGLHLRVENKLIPLSQRAPKLSRKEKRQDSPEAQIDIPSALITVRETSGLDMFQVIGRDLVLNATYTVSASCKRCGKGKIPLVSFNASTPTRMPGCGTAPQVLAFLRFFGTYSLDSLELREGNGSS